MHKAEYVARLKRIEGQVRGLQRMVEEDTYCIDVLNQVSAATKALQSVAMGLVDEHIRHCVADAASGDDQAEAERMITEATRHRTPREVLTVPSAHGDDGSGRRAAAEALGRPPDLEKRLAIIEAAREVLAEVGYTSMTIDAVAQRAARTGC